jgi:molecular chaperone IbpA|tara:strand:- start:1777 stop:1965 length:189 start_codon:yes stop_codon:yes gene_type:complete
MRNFDFTPLYRATVGFDRLADLMDRTLTSQVAQPGFPPYNIEKKAMMPIAFPSPLQDLRPMI